MCGGEVAGLMSSSTDATKDNKKKKRKHRNKEERNRSHDEDEEHRSCDDNDNVAMKQHNKKKVKMSKKDTKRKSIDSADADNDDADGSSRNGQKKRKKRDKNNNDGRNKRNDDDRAGGDEETKKNRQQQQQQQQHFPFNYQYILAPMVGASELAFRLLCRKYGTTLAYTPMMIASEFVKEATTAAAAAAAANGKNNANNSSSSSSSSDYNIANSNICEFQSIPQDRPLVVHFAANDPTIFAAAAQLVERHCDAIDLNLGCPQRTAYLGHFGSYLLTNADRRLICDIIRAGKMAVSVPIFVKIRLLDTIDETMTLCHQLRDAGASLIAIHARYRASWERSSASAREGPALLDQIALIKASMPNFPIIANGNVINYTDVISNLELTGADGIMSAEGILDNPALFLPRYGNVDNNDGGNDCEISIPILSPLLGQQQQQQQQPQCNTNHHHQGDTLGRSGCDDDKAIRKLRKKLREVESIEKKVKVVGDEGINNDQRSKLQLKSTLQAELNLLEYRITKPSSSAIVSSDRPLVSTTGSERSDKFSVVKLSELYKTANDKLDLAKEYLSLVRSYPMKIRSVIFHIRRMCKDLLVKYQLLEECIACTTVDEVESVLIKCDQYIKDPATFHYDLRKATRDKEALDAKRREEDKRRTYEGRMMRKAKREGLVDLQYYLRMGADVPTVEIVTALKHLSKEERLAVWKKDHSQHCMSYHLDDGGCTRDRACAFLHVPAKDIRKFDEDDEVAG